jgi:hypothetical protein
LKVGWEKEMSDVWSPDDIKQFKNVEILDIYDYQVNGLEKELE